jgi:hypothetical protein
LLQIGLNLRKGKTGATEGGGSNFEGIWLVSADSNKLVAG